MCLEHRLFWSSSMIAFLISWIAPASGQTVDVELVCLASPSAADTSASVPTTVAELLNDASFVVEVWAQTTDSAGLSSASLDLSYDATLANGTLLTHSATFNVLTHGTIDNGTGTVDDLSGSHLGSCADAVGVAPNWARVAILDVTALASGSLIMQSSAAGSNIYGTAICGTGDLAEGQISFGSVAVSLVECIVDADCDDGTFCNGAETCDPGTNTCVSGVTPTCDDQIDCTTDICDSQAGGGAGACVNTPVDAACNDDIDCTADACDQLASPGTGCSNAANDAACDDGIACTDDACNQFAGPGTGCSNVANDSLCDNDLFCDGLETCDPATGCADGAAPCTADCEHCVEDSDSCELCILDLDGSGVMGTGDFALFSDCFGACYLPEDPCASSNFNQDLDGCVGTADFATFVGCIEQTCGTCTACSGPGGVMASSALFLDSPDDMPLVRARVVTKEVHGATDVSAVLPVSSETFSIGDRVFVEVWVQRTDELSAGLASAFVDLSINDLFLAIVDVVPSQRFGTLATREPVVSGGVLRAVGGCTTLTGDSTDTGGDWVRVSTVVTRAVAPGEVALSAATSDSLHGFARIGAFENIPASRIAIQGETIHIMKRGRQRGE